MYAKYTAEKNRDCTGRVGLFLVGIHVHEACEQKYTLQRVCEVGLEFAAWDSILLVPRVRVRVRVWVRLTLAVATLFTRNKSNPKLQANFSHFSADAKLLKQTKKPSSIPQCSHILKPFRGIFCLETAHNIEHLMLSLMHFKYHLTGTESSKRTETCLSKLQQQVN